LLRQTGPGALDTIWAEDGSTFLDRALETSLVDAVGEGYAGYLHVIPRIAAEVVTVVPLARAASAIALLAAGLLAGAALLVYVASAGHVRSRPLRALLAALVVLQPAMAVESLNSVALLQWPLTFTAFWLGLWRPSRRSAGVLSGVALLLIAVTAPLAAVLAPILALRLLVVRSWRDRIPALLFAVGVGLQVWAAIAQPWPNPPVPGGTPYELADTYRILVATPAAFGFALADTLRPSLGGLLGVAALLAWLLAVVVAVLPGMPHRLTALTAAATSALAFGVAVFGRHAAPAILAAYDAGRPPGYTRFAVAPILLLLTVVVLAADHPPRGVPSEPWRLLGALVAGFLLVVAGMDLRSINDRTLGPAWSTEIVKGVHECRAGVEEVTLQITPPTESFRLTVPCGQLPP
jgi:hypothetical protein